ncbi:Maf family protein [Luteimonas vadosa]|uniref:7-methyl-GTP pyrophosphatase n=1 Tax=Luteimonas vadosa TaxID=1165507 RepID=A0ABP9DYC3_9GAMM
MQLRLASTSPYRRELLARLGLPFDTTNPCVDETPLPGETPRDLVVRLARAKAESVARQVDDGACVIGSDQAADLDGQPLGKPGSHEAAVAQLTLLSGRTIRFQTAVALVRSGGACLEAVDTTIVRMRSLEPQEIARYLATEPAYDCAGSFKSESLGIALFEAVDTSDPTALVGLPLVATARLLRQAGFAVP